MRLAAAVAVAAGVTLLVADAALAQADPIGDQLISALDGFTSDPRGSDGPLDAAALVLLASAGGAGGDEVDEALAALREAGATGYLRTFERVDGTTVVVFGVQPIPEGEHGDFAAGLRSELDDTQELSPPGGDDRVVASSGRYPGLGGVRIGAMVSGDVVVVVQALGPDHVDAFEAAMLAQLELTPPTADASGGGETAAYRAGRVLGVLLVFGIPIGLVVRSASRRGRRPAGDPAPPPPGSWGPPPGAPPVTMPWGATPPPPPPGGVDQADPWAPRFPATPPPAPPVAPPPAADEDGHAPIE